MILVAVFTAGLALVFLATLSRFEVMRRRPPNGRGVFMQKLVRDLSGRVLQDLDDVHLSYRRFFGTDVMRSAHLEELDELLQGATRQIAAGSQGSAENGVRETIQRIHEVRAANRRALDVERMCAPFSGTPDDERRILKALLTCPSGDQPTMATQLNALAKTIRFRQDSLERLRAESDRSLQLARWGWYGTLTLAILLAMLGLLCLGL
jgi:hypothetical protein